VTAALWARICAYSNSTTCWIDLNTLTNYIRPIKPPNIAGPCTSSHSGLFLFLYIIFEPDMIHGDMLGPYCRKAHCGVACDSLEHLRLHISEATKPSKRRLA
jgi:hypothetical protein